MATTEEYVTSKQIKTRLKRSAGQLDGVLRMMDENRPCEDVLVQLSAVKSSIDKAMKLVIARNINNCVDEEKLEQQLGFIGEIIDYYVSQYETDIPFLTKITNVELGLHFNKLFVDLRSKIKNWIKNWIDYL